MSPDFIEQGFFTYESGRVAAAKILDLEDKPTAIFAANDEMAGLAIELLASKKFVDECKESSRDYRHVLGFQIVDRESSASYSG